MEPKLCACGQPIKYANESRCEDCFAIGAKESCTSGHLSLELKKKMNRFDGSEHAGAYKSRGVVRKK